VSLALITRTPVQSWLELDDDRVIATAWDLIETAAEAKPKPRDEGMVTSG
jgi:hypothetical protein